MTRSPRSCCIRWPLGISLILLVVFVAPSCVFFEELEGPAREARVVVSEASLSLNISEKKQLTATFYDTTGDEVSDVEWTWQTEDAAIARVDQSGMVEGRAVGETTVQVLAGEASAAVSVSVVAPTERVEVEPSSVELFPGESAQLSATVFDPDDAIIAGRAITWSSAEPEIATVDADGLITAVSAGSTELTARTPDASAYVTVQVLKWRQIGAGYHYSCGVLSNGAAYCWGRNNINGVLGNGSIDSGSDNNALANDANADEPTPVDGDIEFAAVSVGLFHTCGLTPDAQAYCWGAGGAGHLGNGANNDSPTPVAVNGTYEFTDLQLGANHACALDTSDDLYCWGYNVEGQLGLGEDASSSYFSPQRVLDHKFVALAVGTNHVCAISQAGPTLCWGEGLRGQLGNGTTTISLELVQVDTTEDFTAIAAGYDHTCALNAAGEVYCWGANDHLGLGDGTTADQSRPVHVDITHTYEKIFAGSSTTCGIDSSHDIYCWGFNGQGNLGNATTGTEEASRVLVSGGNAWQGTSLGLMHSCALTLEDGRAFCWGDNDSGQVGNGGSESFFAVPTAVSNP